MCKERKQLCNRETGSAFLLCVRAVFSIRLSMQPMPQAHAELRHKPSHRTQHTSSDLLLFLTFLSLLFSSARQTIALREEQRAQSHSFDVLSIPCYNLSLFTSLPRTCYLSARRLFNCTCSIFSPTLPHHPQFHPPSLLHCDADACVHRNLLLHLVPSCFFLPVLRSPLLNSGRGQCKLRDS